MVSSLSDQDLNSLWRDFDIETQVNLHSFFSYFFIKVYNYFTSLFCDLFRDF